MIVPDRVKIRFDASECCNIFAFGRSEELMNLPKNVHVVGTILQGKDFLICLLSFFFVQYLFAGFPHLFVEALDDLPAGTELIFDWGDVNLGQEI